MFGGNCRECGSSAYTLFIMKKSRRFMFIKMGEKFKNRVCPSCKEKLEKKGWIVCGKGMY